MHFQAVAKSGSIRMALIAEYREWKRGILPSLEAAQDLSNEVAEIHLLIDNLIDEPPDLHNLADLRDYEMSHNDFAQTGMHVFQWIDYKTLYFAADAPMEYWKAVYGNVFNPNLTALIEHAFKQILPALLSSTKEVVINDDLTLPEPVLPARK